MVTNNCASKRKNPKKIFKNKTIKKQLDSDSESDFVEVYFQSVHKMRNYGYSKRIVSEEYTSYHHYHSLYPGLSDSEEYAKSNYDGWFYED